MISRNPRFSVLVEGGETKVSFTDTDLVTYDSTNKAFTVRNTPGAALPNTGGPGTNQIYLLGIMLTGIAGMGLVMWKKRSDPA